MPTPCRTCRKRKRACDGIRPKCKACQTAGRQCGGYEPHVKGVFVNLDADTISTPKKGLISEAIVTARKSHDVRDLEHALATASLHTLDLPTGAFEQHFVTLWAHFQTAYARTHDNWSIGVSDLGLHNQALDLALISLATMRLSLCGQKETYRVLSLSTYNVSIQIFRRIVQNDIRTSGAVLVVISLIFTLFEAAQQKPTQIYRSGWAGHLNGALALMRRQGPQEFQSGGLHVAFKKLREMAILWSFSMHQESFLARSEWMEVPWKTTPKTSRDRLHDIGVRMTALYSSVHRIHHTRLAEATHDEKLRQYWRLNEELINWQQDWLWRDYGDLLVICRGCDQHPCLCFPHPSLFPSNEFSYMAAEYLALLLIITYTAIHVLDHTIVAQIYAQASLNDGLQATSLRKRAQWLRDELQNVLVLPCFGQAISDSPGITEGRCRSLLPVWVLSQDHAIASTEQEQIWWPRLNNRLNYGV